MKYLIYLLLLTELVFAQAEYTSRLRAKLENSSSTEYIRTLCLLRDRVDIQALDNKLYSQKATMNQRAYEVITKLQEKANITQFELVQFLNSKLNNNEVKSYERFWITNLIMVEGTKSVIKELLQRKDIEFMDIDALLNYDQPKFEGPAPEGVTGSETGLKVINADKLWKLGLTGKGRLLMGIDTGVDASHVALSSRWRGRYRPSWQAWFDPANNTTTPSDCDVHGTHTMGIMVGRDSIAFDTVGVAPDAHWIAAKTICTSPHTSRSIAAFQWAMNPDSNINTIDDMPDAINNSWYDPDVSSTQCTGIYKTTLDAVEAAGIAVCFSAGNNGPGVSTITAPKNINTDLVNVFCVANVNGNTPGYPIASSSSRGPSTCGGTGSLLIKPEVSAPGSSVRSCTPNNTYQSLSGTSMASPHAAGAIALLKQLVPNMTGREIKLALYNTAVDLGEPGEDNTYGKGIIDVYAAFLYLFNRDSIAPAPISNMEVTEITSGSVTLSWTVPADSSPGGVTKYDIRYSTSPINDTIAFNNATKVLSPPKPDSAGKIQTFKVDGLNFSTTYYFSIRCFDVWNNASLISNPASAQTLAKPVISVSKDSLNFIKTGAIQFIDSLMISNISQQPSFLNFSVTTQNHTFPTKNISLQLLPINNISEQLASNSKANDKYNNGMSVTGGGGPDAFGYRWKDSDAPGGPVFEWNSIANIGDSVTLGDDAFLTKSLPFTFNFYGVNYNSVEVVSNGYLRFVTATSSYPTNGAIPSTSAPNGGIYGFWDDLAPNKGGKIYVYGNAAEGRFVLEFNDVPRYNDYTSRMTFQIEIKKSGMIIFRYKNMTGTLNSATVGIEDHTGTIGLQSVYNAAYIKNNFAIKFQKEPEWLNIPTVSGTIANNKQMAVKLQINTAELPKGNYRMEMKISSNDSTKPVVIVPVNLKITDTTGYVTSSIPISTGWNLISIPVQPVSGLKTDLFPNSLSYAYHFNGSYIVKDTINMGYGYWLKFPETVNHSISGLSPYEVTIPLNEGWNIIGCINDSLPIAGLITTPPAIISSNYYSYNGGYNIVNTLKAGGGYWVKANSAGTMLLKKSLYKESVKASIPENYDRLIVTDNTGNTSSLYLVSNSVKTELPPPPPAGLFDLRFSDNSMTAEISAENIVVINTNHFPVKVRLSGKTGYSYKVEDMINGKLFNAILDKEIVISDSRINLFKISGLKQNLSYELRQNYPNPFNPTTTISYQIPDAGIVTLKIYDVLGNLIETLVDKNQEPGKYNIEWNAEKYSSGVYYYEIKAGDFRSIKKMLLIK